MMAYSHGVNAVCIMSNKFQFGFLCCFCSVLLTAHASTPKEDGNAFARQFLQSRVKPASGESSGDALLSQMGVDVKSLGSPSFGQQGDMGIIGKRTREFSIPVKPLCQAPQIITGLSDVTLTVACQDANRGGLQVGLCRTQQSTVKNREDCKPEMRWLPSDGQSHRISGFDWALRCESDSCHLKMSEPQTIHANANNLEKTAVNETTHNAAYQSTVSSAKSDNGYNTTNAYLKSWQENGEDAGLTRCVDGMEGALQKGTLSDCAGNQSTDLYGNCKTTRTCVRYTLDHETTSTNRICHLTATAKPLVCHRSPVVTVTQKPITFANCQQLIITQGASYHCPIYYRQIVKSNMLSKPTWDDVKLCTHPASDDVPLCYGGGYYIVRRTSHSPLDEGHAIVPKSFHSRLQLTNAYNHQQIAVTLINEASRAMLIDHQPVSDGAVIELPYSDSETQSFRFFLSRLPDQSDSTGVLVLLIDHQDIERTAHISTNETCPTTTTSIKNCKNPSARCIQQGEVRVINGLPVWQDCWEQEASYQCPDWQMLQNDCDNQINCRAEGNPKIIDAWHQTLNMRCEESSLKKTCAQWQTRSDCRDQPINYAQGNEQFDTTPTDNFNTAFQQFSLLDALQQSASGDPVSVFTGKSTYCRKPMDVLTVNCCDRKLGSHTSGFHINSCDQFERDLAAARRAHRTHEVGQWCAHYLPPPLEHTCSEDRQGVCIFDSILGRLIQEQGRQQINALAAKDPKITPITWGTAEHPNCQGLTPEQLGLIDFSQLDLSEWQREQMKKAKTPSLSQQTDSTQQGIRHFKDALQGKTSASTAPPNRSDNGVLTVTPKEGQAPFTVTLTANAYWPKYLPLGQCDYTAQAKQNPPVVSIDVDWGDGSSRSHLSQKITIAEQARRINGSGTCRYQVPVFRTTHRYGLPPNHTVTEKIVATFKTATGSHKATFDVTNSWDADNGAPTGSGLTDPSEKAVAINRLPIGGTFNPNDITGIVNRSD